MKINLKKLQESIDNDLGIIYEGLNTGEAKKLYSLIVDLYEEISSFEKEAPSAAINALSPHLNQVRDGLESMLKEPMNYVSKSEDDLEKDHEQEDEDVDDLEDSSDLEDFEVDVEDLEKEEKLSSKES